MTTDGYLDSYAFVGGGGGLMLMGWVSSRWSDRSETCPVELHVGEEVVKGEAILCLYPREDVRHVGHGLIILLPAEAAPTGMVDAVALHSPDGSLRLAASHTIAHVSDFEMVLRMRAALRRAPDSRARTRLLEALPQAPVSGADTFAALDLPVHIELDAAYLCPPSGLLLRGWWADPFQQVQAVRLRSGASSHVVDLTDGAEQPRPDVIELFRQKGVLLDRVTGFMAFFPRNAWQQGTPTILEVQTVSGEVACKPLGLPTGVSLAAMKDLLDSFEVRVDRLDRLFDATIGPAVRAMSAFRLAAPPHERVVRFGQSPARPRCSLVIPLHGRVDFLEYQCVLMARRLCAEDEIVYVLDDPSLERAAERLCASCFARFRTPVTLVVLSRNVGYAPASNIGLRHAAGEFTCFLNSDVVPQSPDWLDCMVETLRADRHVGVVGARLLFEDGTVQHDGCALETLPEHGGWSFIAHPGKGRAPRPAADIAPVEAVTGACLLLRTALARELAGFDAGYVIGDFEDFDLCLRVRQKGLRCVIDRRATLFHLERQSQGDPAQRWRVNLTWFNAWVFRRTWAGQDVALAPVAPAETAGMVA